MIKAELNSSFPGSETFIFNASNNGVGIPASNPNLDSDVEAKVKEIFKKVQDGEITVSAEQGDLIK